eukprot:365456-Chlamydomonas_euryale.AAC.16
MPRTLSMLGALCIGHEKFLLCCSAALLCRSCMQCVCTWWIEFFSRGTTKPTGPACKCCMQCPNLAHDAWMRTCNTSSAGLPGNRCARCSVLRHRLPIVEPPQHFCAHLEQHERPSMPCLTLSCAP